MPNAVRPSTAPSAILPTVLLLDPDRAIRTVLAQALGRAGYQARAAASVPGLLAWIEDGEGDLLIVDHGMMTTGDLADKISALRPDLPILRLGAQTAGPNDMPKPFDLPTLLDRVAFLLRAPVPRPDTADQPAAHRQTSALTGISPAIEELRQGVARLSASALPLMLLGERGCGRSMVVRVLHESGPRRNGPLIVADAAAIAPSDQVAWLAGAGPGDGASSTGNGNGAFNERDGGPFVAKGGGLFARAGFGTLYIASLERLGTDGQAALLHLLQNRAHPPDFRLVVSANEDLGALARTGRFRADLYYRLDTVRLRVPPLRERREDIGILAAHFWQAAHVGVAAGVTEAARLVLSQQDWPGNLDELKAAIGRIASLHPGPILDEARVQAERLAQSAPADTNATHAAEAPQAITPSPETLQAAIGRHIDHYLAAQDLSTPMEGRLHEEVIAEVERPLIAGVLAATGGNQIRAASLLGMNRNTLRKRIRDLGIATRLPRAAAGRRRPDAAAEQQRPNTAQEHRRPNTADGKSVEP